MSVKLLTKHLLEVLSLKGGCACSSESRFVKTPHCWKSHVVAHLIWCMVQEIYARHLSFKMATMVALILQRKFQLNLTYGSWDVENVTTDRWTMENRPYNKLTCSIVSDISSSQSIWQNFLSFSIKLRKEYNILWMHYTPLYPIVCIYSL